MNWNLNNAMQWVIIFALLLTGCTTIEPNKKLCSAAPKLAPVDWIMVSGTSLPATTVVIGECGLTLADCLVVSRTIETLDYQSEQSQVESKSVMAAGQPDSRLSESQRNDLNSVLKVKAVNAVDFDTVVSDAALILQSRSSIDIPDDWELGFPDVAFDKTLGRPHDIQTIAAQIQELNPRHRIEATKHFQALLKEYADEKKKDDPNSELKGSRDYLRSLAKDGRLIVGDYQKLRSWCYSMPSTQFDAEKALGSFGSKRVTPPVMGEVPAKETMMVLVHRGPRCVVIPLPMVFESAFGGYWVEPGDHLFLARFGELPFRSQMNDMDDLKNVGITGMVATEGVWPTTARSLASVISSFPDDIDLRSNMMMVAQVNNNVVFQCMLPLNMTSLSTGRSTQMESLIREWGLVDGLVVSFQNSGLSPLLLNSTQKLRLASDLHRRRSVDHSKLCQHDLTGDSPYGTIEPESPNPIASRFSLANDACQTFQDSLKSMRNVSYDMFNNLPFPGN